MTEIVVRVRDLARFCYRGGDIDHRFTASPTGVEGTRGHQRVYRRRPPSYQSEYALEYRHRVGKRMLVLRGRADGYDPQQRLLEEIKTCRIPFTRIPQALSQWHLAQARLYAGMLVQQSDLDSVTVCLTWFNIDSGEEQSLNQEYGREELKMFLAASLQRFGDWLERLSASREQRDHSARQLPFPHGRFRSGQRDVAERVYRCLARGGQLLLEAPTGIGKTAAVLYPAIKGFGHGKHDVVVYVTAKTVGRRAAEQTLEMLEAAGYRGGGLTLNAKDAVCLSPGQACHGDDCSYARGYYDKLPGAMAAALDTPLLGREALVELGREYGVCPYQLAFDLAPWMDLVIADQHYLYSLTAGLGDLLADDSRRWTVLVDEAHNLPERARAMYRGVLAKASLMAARRAAPPSVRPALEAVNRVLLDLQKEPWQEDGFDSRAEVPAELSAALSRFAQRVGEQLTEQPLLLQRHGALRDFYFEVLQFQRVADNWGDEFCFEMTRGAGQQSLALVLNCLDPARLLGERQRRAHAVIAFSATLSPPQWSRPALGLEPDAVCVRQASPFAATQLQVSLATDIDTRFRERASSLVNLANRIRQWLDTTPGNCLVYFSSYRYLADTVETLSAGGLPAARQCWFQRPDADRDSLLALLEQRRDVVAFCILGGVFGEAVDLPGDQLASVVVVGVGLPQFNRDSERLRAWHQQQHGDGFAYAYLYPGMQKVDQALGRVVRRDDDKGHALLIDARYAQPQYRNLLPPWWTYTHWAGARGAEGAPGDGTDADAELQSQLPMPAGNSR